MQPGYDEAPPSYEYDETSGVAQPLNNLDPSAPPDYNDLAIEDAPSASAENEGATTNDISQHNIPNEALIPSLQSPQRSIYIVKMPNEPVPIITVITPDLIPQYQSEHIVYPKSQSGASQIQVIKPIIARNIATKSAFRVKSQQHSRFDAPSSYNADNNIPLFVPKQQTNKHKLHKQIAVTHHSPAYQHKSKTMLAHYNQSNDLNLCGGSDNNEDKRTPLEIPNKFNLMYGRMNFIIILYLWVIFIMIRLNEGNNVDIKKYCYNEYPKPSGTYSWSCDSASLDYISCGDDPVCYIVDDYYDSGNTCYDEHQDCQCCADTGFGGTIEGVYIAFYVFLAVNTFRLFFLSFAYGMHSINQSQPSLYVIDNRTNKIKLQQYMDYLCDHPASYIIGVFYSEAGKAITEGIIYNVAFPATRFLYFNIILLYIPFFVLISVITNAQMYLLDTNNAIVNDTPSPTTAAPTNIYGYAAPTMNPVTFAPTQPTTPPPTYSWDTPAPTTPPNEYQLKSDLLITCVIGLGLLLIGFIMHLYRWRKKNKIERMNLKKKAEAEGKEIVVGPVQSSSDFAMCGWGTLDESVRIPSETANKWNLLYRWFNLIIFAYLWVLLVFGIIEYGWFIGDAGACIAYIVFLAFNTVRIMIVTVVAGIRLVDNEYNYIVNDETGKVKLRHFMDYLCDHPAGFVVGFLYEDVGVALHEALIYNITFPDTHYLFENILIFYIPLMIVSLFQATHKHMNQDLSLLYTIGASGCGIGIVSNAYRFKMRNDIQTANSNK